MERNDVYFLILYNSYIIFFKAEIVGRYSEDNYVYSWRVGSLFEMNLENWKLHFNQQIISVNLNDWVKQIVWKTCKVRKYVAELKALKTLILCRQ